MVHVKYSYILLVSFLFFLFIYLIVLPVALIYGIPYGFMLDYTYIEKIQFLYPYHTLLISIVASFILFLFLLVVKCIMRYS
ncbi:hypothetical protein KLEB273_gp218 [Bacillus phage vB_BauM_KLEB27-3]|nr:hypothetical protein KLEB273_gp218 [Bacillus phage vB_BauM_KLEB27-3]